MTSSVLFALLLIGPGGLATSSGVEPSDGPESETVGVGHAAVGALRLGNAGYGLSLGWRARTKSGIAGGLDFESVYLPEAFIGGLRVEDDLGLALRAPFFFPLYRSRTLTIALNLAPGARYLRSYEPNVSERDGFSVTLDLGASAYLHRRAMSWMIGVDNPVSVQVRPITDVNLVGTLLTTGPIVPISERVQWFATVEAGGVFGSDGDAGKFLVRGTTGLRAMFGPSARKWRAIY